MAQRNSTHDLLSPPLESGDRLTRSEFERRYEMAAHVKKAELVEGVVYVASPARFRHHGKPHASIMGWLVVYAARTPGVEAGDNATLRLDLDNEPQPDACLLLPSALGGKSWIDADDYLAGTPELIVEVAASSASYDLGTKKNAYRRNGIQEYLVWRVFDNAIDWFTLREQSYERLEPDEDGVLRSQVFPGLWLAARALLHDQMPQVLKTLEEGLLSAEHLAFEARLEAALRR